MVETRPWSGLVYVRLSYATFGLVVRANIVVDAPPISRSSIGRHITEVARYYRGRGGTVEAVRPLLP